MSDLRDRIPLLDLFTPHEERFEVFMEALKTHDGRTSREWPGPPADLLGRPGRARSAKVAELRPSHLLSRRDAGSDRASARPTQRPPLTPEAASDAPRATVARRRSALRSSVTTRFVSSASARLTTEASVPPRGRSAYAATSSEMRLHSCERGARTSQSLRLLRKRDSTSAPARRPSRNATSAIQSAGITNL